LGRRSARGRLHDNGVSGLSTRLTGRPKGHTLYDKLRGATKDPMQQAVRDALIAFMAAISQKARAESTKAAQRAGIEHARSTKTAPTSGSSQVSHGLSSLSSATCWGSRRSRAALAAWGL
jgi:hypothetical protein